MAVRSQLGFLEQSAAKDDSSRKELAKFGFSKHTPTNLLSSFDEASTKHDEHVHDHARVDHRSGEIPTNEILQFGSLEFPYSLDNHECLGKRTFGKNHNSRDWSNIPLQILEHILDFRQAHYDEIDIRQCYGLKELPFSEAIYEILGRCSRCFALDHTVYTCTAQLCGSCQNYERACCCALHPMGRMPQRCTRCNSPAHLRTDCPGLLSCPFILASKEAGTARD